MLRVQRQALDSMQRRLVAIIESSHDAIVSEIRAILLAAVRSAVLWRQLGGSYWDLLFARRAMADA